MFLASFGSVLSSAPHDCLQWFTDAVGTFSSFNYLYAATPVVQHLANQDYTICIRTNEVYDSSPFFPYWVVLDWLRVSQ